MFKYILLFIAIKFSFYKIICWIYFDKWSENKLITYIFTIEFMESLMTDIPNIKKHCNQADIHYVYYFNFSNIFLYLLPK